MHLNQLPYRPKTLADVWRWKRASAAKPWPARIENPRADPPVRTSHPAELTATFINHSTVLLQYHGLALLTDPIWSERASPFSWAGPRRVRAPGLALDQLPAPDVLLVSHNHYDHLDLPTLRRIARRCDPLVLTGTGNGTLIRSGGLSRVEELAWWEGRAVGGLTIHYVPAQHFSCRGLRDRMHALWGGFVLESPHGHVYFAGDTAVGPHEEQLRERFGGFRLSFLPIGAYEPRWFMKASHMNPAEAVEAHRRIGSRLSVGIHWGTFPLSDEAVDQPLADLAAALTAQHVPSSAFRTLGFGETLRVP